MAMFYMPSKWLFPIYRKIERLEYEIYIYDKYRYICILYLEDSSLATAVC